MSPPASTSSTLTALLSRNAAYAKESHTPIQTNTQIKALGVPAYKTFIISCTDGRIDPAKFLDIDTPHEFLISRNSGARARSSLPNLLALDDLVTIETVLVIGHTDCGARSFDEDAIRRVLRERAGNAGNAGDEVDGIDVEGLEFGRIRGEVHDSVRADVKFLKESPLVREGLKGGIFGLVFDIESGKLERVV